VTGLRERLVGLPTVVVLVLTVAVAGLVGAAGGGTLALWRDVEQVTASMPAGVVVFGAGAPAPAGPLADYATGPDDTVEFRFGPGAAETLYTTGSVFIPIQVDALAQGHRGLRYTVSRQIAPGGVFADSVLRLVKVPRMADCRAGVVGEETTGSAPVTADYSTTTALTTEYWCLAAAFQPMKGTYDNQASVTAGVTTSSGAAAGTVSDQDGWSAQVRKTFVPANEGTHRVTFSFTTFRAGE